MTDDTVDVKQSGFGWQSKGQGFESPQLHSCGDTGPQRVPAGQAEYRGAVLDLSVIDYSQRLR